MTGNYDIVYMMSDMAQIPYATGYPLKTCPIMMDAMISKEAITFKVYNIQTVHQV